MNPITLPTSPETRAALEKLDWQVDPINAGYEVLMKGWSTVGLWADGNHTISATASEWNEVAAILRVGAPQGDAVRYLSAPNPIRDVLRAAALYVEEQRLRHHVDANDGSQDYRKGLRFKALGEAVDALQRDAFSSPRQAPPRAAVNGGTSPSPLAAIDDKTAALMSEALDHEPGFHQVNPVNQRKAGAMSANPLILLEVLYNCAVNDSRLSPEVERQIRQAIGADNVAEPTVVADVNNVVTRLKLAKTMHELDAMRMDVVQAIHAAGTNEAFDRLQGAFIKAQNRLQRIPLSERTW